MSDFTAGQLDTRNIGSSVGFYADGYRIFGQLAKIVREPGESVTQIYLAHDDEVFDLPHATPVDVALQPAANFAMFSKNLLAEILEELRGSHALAA